VVWVDEALIIGVVGNSIRRQFEKTVVGVEH
jgi:hypothetical protein